MSEPFNQSNETSCLEITGWQQINSNLKAGFTTRNAGVSERPYHSFNLGFHVDDKETDVRENRGLLAERLHFPLQSWVSSEQTHGTNIKVITQVDKGKGATSNQNRIKDTDGFITNEADILCTALFADCVPLFFFDPKTKYIGIAHAGWKGTVNHIASKMVQKFTSLGVDRRELLVAIGPSISQENFEVDSFIIEKVEEENRQKTAVFLDENRFLLDLKQLNVEILLKSGILRNNIDVTTYCSSADEDLFFSHRRDKGKTGRMLGYIGFIKGNK